jgi:hypothetical protein
MSAWTIAPTVEVLMQYVCLVYLEESRMAAMTADESATLDEASLAHNEELRLSGHLIVAQALVEPMVLITTDVRLGAYPGNIEVIE